ncbi:hypothetical protein D3C80_1424160 [compost metagenome]
MHLGHPAFPEGGLRIRRVEAQAQVADPHRLGVVDLRKGEPEVADALLDRFDNGRPHHEPGGTWQQVQRLDIEMIGMFVTEENQIYIG